MPRDRLSATTRLVGIAVVLAQRGLPVLAAMEDAEEADHDFLRTTGRRHRNQRPPAFDPLAVGRGAAINEREGCPPAIGRGQDCLQEAVQEGQRRRRWIALPRDGTIAASWARIACSSRSGEARRRVCSLPA